MEKQLLPTCKELGVSVQAYSPLEQGLLTGKVTMETTYPEGSTRNSNPSFQPARRAQALDMLAKWGDLTEKYDCSLAQLVIALTARMIPGLHVLCGARTPQQVMDNAGALNIKLDGADAVRMKWDIGTASASLWDELRLPAYISHLRQCSCLAGRGPNNSFLLPPLAAVVVVA